MGTMKKYRGQRALECFMAHTMTGQIDSNYRSYSTIKYKTVTGNVMTNASFNRTYYNPLGLFMGGIIPIASSDTLSDYTGEEYLNDGIGTATVLSNNLTIQDDKVTRLVEVKIKNTTSSSITIGCVKILKDFTTNTDYRTLCLGYYFDEPFTLDVDEEVVKTLRFDFGQ